MPTDRENFEAWFVQPLESLYPKEEFGFIIVMGIFPLLERYLRQKVGLPVGKPNKAFYAAFEELFPLGGEAKGFWWRCRNGLLHYGAFNSHGVFIVHGQNEPIKVDGATAPAKIFRIEPVAFARKVLATIVDNFTGYATLAPPLPMISWLDVTDSSPPQEVPWLTPTLGTGAPLPQAKPSDVPASLKDIMLP